MMKTPCLLLWVPAYELFSTLRIIVIFFVDDPRFESGSAAIGEGKRQNVQ